MSYENKSEKIININIIYKTIYNSKFRIFGKDFV